MELMMRDSWLVIETFSDSVKIIAIFPVLWRAEDYIEHLDEDSWLHDSPPLCITIMEEI